MCFQSNVWNPKAEHIHTFCSLHLYFIASNVEQDKCYITGPNTSNSVSALCVVFRCFYLQASEAVALVTGELCVDEFSEKKLSELWTLNTQNKSNINTQILHDSTDWHKPPRPLTFLKTAGWGRGGPNGGTSSRAVTDTCQPQQVETQHHFILQVG